MPSPVYRNPEQQAPEVQALEGQGELLVFAYGSLMWRPDFPHAGGFMARVYGYHRALCLTSTRYRGTAENPGLVLGLDRGGSCVGQVWRVAAQHRRGVVDGLNTRELIHRIYQARFLTVYDHAHQPHRAYGFVADRQHGQYAGGLSEDQRVAMIAHGRGSLGTSRDYLAMTLAHLAALGIINGPLHRLLARVEREYALI